MLISSNIFAVFFSIFSIENICKFIVSIFDFSGNTFRTPFHQWVLGGILLIWRFPKLQALWTEYNQNWCQPRPHLGKNTYYYEVDTYMKKFCWTMLPFYLLLPPIQYVYESFLLFLILRYFYYTLIKKKADWLSLKISIVFDFVLWLFAPFVIRSLLSTTIFSKSILR